MIAEDGQSGADMLRHDPHFDVVLIAPDWNFGW